VPLSAAGEMAEGDDWVGVSVPRVQFVALLHSSDIPYGEKFLHSGYGDEVKRKLDTVASSVTRLAEMMNYASSPGIAPLWKREEMNLISWSSDIVHGHFAMRFCSRERGQSCRADG
jgi:hypothetical protein